MKYIKTNNTLIMIIDDKNYIITEDHVNYDKILGCIELGKPDYSILYYINNENSVEKVKEILKKKYHDE